MIGPPPPAAQQKKFTNSNTERRETCTGYPNVTKQMCSLTENITVNENTNLAHQRLACASLPWLHCGHIVELVLALSTAETSIPKKLNQGCWEKLENAFLTLPMKHRRNLCEKLCFRRTYT